MEASTGITFLLILIVMALLFINGKIRRLALSVEALSNATQGIGTTAEGLRQAVGTCVELTFSTGSRDTVHILDVDDYCVLAECVKPSLSVPIGTQWVLPIKHIVSIRTVSR